MFRPAKRAFAATVIALGCVAPSLALDFGQVDDFEDGTTAGWLVNLLGFGGSAPPPQNISTGGPGGTDDNYMLLTSTGNPGPGGKLVAININQWSGDYIAEGVNRITMDVNNLGGTDIFLRLLFESVGVGGPTDVAATTAAFHLPAGSGWQSVSFDVNASDLTALLGSAENALSNATLLRIFHSPLTEFPGPDSAALLGVDNVRAVPEPATIAALGGGLALLMRRRKRR